MKITITHNSHHYSCDLSQPLDISIPIGQVRCFFAGPFKAEPFKSGNFVGAVEAGAPVNFFSVQFNPHGHGTHTECFGHLTLEQESVDQTLSQYHFLAQLVSVPIVENGNGDKVLSIEALKKSLAGNSVDALIIRSLPNEDDKLTKDYSGTNPPYLSKESMQYIVDQNIQHLLLDLPSVDREEDGGHLTAHRIFWNMNDGISINAWRQNCTITELIFVNNEIRDGLYLLNIQIPSLQLDAAPSKPVIYKLEKTASKT